MDNLGRTLVLAGLALVVIGGIVWLIGRSGGGFLPGDIVIERKNFRFYFPVVTCLLVSAVLTLVAWLARK